MITIDAHNFPQWTYGNVTLKIVADNQFIDADGDTIAAGTGTGTQTFTPVVETRFANNKYRDNYAPDGIRTAPTGTSVIYSRFTDFRKSGTVTVNPSSVSANSVSSQTFTLTGAVVGDSLTLNPPSAGLTSGLLVMQSFVSAANTITIVFQNTTASPIDEASASWTYSLSR